MDFIFYHKIKLFDDIISTNKIANNLTTTSSGYVLDARQGKTLSDRLYGYKFIVKSKTYSSNSSGRIVFSNDDIPINAKGVTANAIGANSSTLVGTCTVPWLYTIDNQWRTMLVNTSGSPAMQPVPNTSVSIYFTYWILA